MEDLNLKSMDFLSQSLTNATGLPVRIYENDTRIAYHSMFSLTPDPAGGDLARLLDIPNRAGVIATPLLQYYGFFPLSGGQKMIIGPSRAENNSSRLLREQMILLGVPPQDQEEYQRCLRCLPVYSMERMSWLICLLSSISSRREIPVDALFVSRPPADRQEAVYRGYAQNSLPADTGDEILLDNGYRFEQMLLTFVEQGEPQRVRELLNAPPSMLVGQLSRDTLRQAKNLAICGATIASRAAIAGGLDSRTAFRMSDLYIQQIELTQDAAAVNRLRSDMFADFAAEVQRIRYHVRPELSGGKGSLFVQCAEYVSQNIFSPIRAQEMAEALGYTRSYLCSRFRELSGMTLSQYIMQEKIFEAQRLLRFSDQSLSQLAALLAFSSQSHFQNAFKKQTGETPAQYRKRML